MKKKINSQALISFVIFLIVLARDPIVFAFFGHLSDRDPLSQNINLFFFTPLQIIGFFFSLYCLPSIYRDWKKCAIRTFLINLILVLPMLIVFAWALYLVVIIMVT
jgi:hypothetical protein